MARSRPANGVHLSIVIVFYYNGQEAETVRTEGPFTVYQDMFFDTEVFT